MVKNNDTIFVFFFKKGKKSKTQKLNFFTYTLNWNSIPINEC